MPFDETVVVCRFKGKIFACICLDKPNFATMKCDVDRSVELRERYGAIEPAWYWNKKYWNQIRFDGDVHDDPFQQLSALFLICHLIFAVKNFYI